MTSTETKETTGHSELGTSVHVSVSPHIRHKDSTATIMRDVMIALTPACIMGVYTFGWRVLAILLVTVASCILTELV